jgi:hypothetical protein
MSEAVVEPTKGSGDLETAMRTIREANLTPELWMWALASTYTDRRITEGFCRDQFLRTYYQVLIEKAKP